MNKSVFFAAVLFLISVMSGASSVYAEGYSASFSLLQHDVSTCPAGGGQLIFAMIKNTGENPDTYRISATRDWVVMPEVYLEPGEESRVGILVAIGDPTVVPSRYSVDLTLHSGRSKNAYKDTISVKTLDCAGIVIQPKAEAFFGCTKEQLSAIILLRNPGNVADTFEISASKGTLSNSTVNLESGEEKEVLLTVTPVEGNEEVTVRASSKISYAQGSANVLFVGRGCYSSVLSIEPSYVRTCKEDGAEFAVRISNTGERADMYTITSNVGNLSAKTLEVMPNTTTTSILKVVPEKEGVQEVDVGIVSENVKQSAKAEISSERCYVYGISIVPETMLSENYSGIISSIVLNNTGTKQDKYTISLEGATWMEVAPGEITVEPNTTKRAYIYVSPVYGIKNGTYTANVIVSSEKTKGQLLKQFKFEFGNASGANASVSPITGQATKTISTKVVYALIIGLAVVLIFLFGREFRKMSKEEEKKEEAAPDKKEPEKREKKQKKKKDKKESEVSEDIKDILEGI